MRSVVVEEVVPPQLLSGLKQNMKVQCDRNSRFDHLKKGSRSHWQTDKRCTPKKTHSHNEHGTSAHKELNQPQQLNHNSETTLA